MMMMMNVGPVRTFSQNIESRRDFDRLTHGYERLAAISYVVSPDLLLQLFQTYGFNQIEIVVGENLSGSSLVDRYRESLSQRGEQATRQLAELVRSERLRIWVPRRCIHSKLGRAELLSAWLSAEPSSRAAGRRALTAAGLTATTPWPHERSSLQTEEDAGRTGFGHDDIYD
jgi:hypothetical protein